MSKTKTNAYEGLADVLSGGFDDAMMNGGAERPMFDLADIEIEQQVREEFEDELESLEDLGESLIQGQIQPIVLRPNRPGRPKPYLLIAGERRCRAAELKGLTKLWGDLKTGVSDEEAERIQFAENVHRKNLTQTEMAKRIQRDLNAMGSTEAYLAHIGKSRAWLSKVLSLLDLPEQAKRLVDEKISADLEVINTVKTIEKLNPGKAREVVDELKTAGRKVNARETVNKAKDTVKPPKKKPGGTGSVATPRDRAQEAPSKGAVFADAKPRAGRKLHEDALSDAFMQLFEGGKTPKMVLDGMKAAQREAIDDYLRTFYEAGKQAKNPGRIVVEGFRNGGFATDGVGAFALVAYLQGMEADAKFSPLNIFGCLKV